MNIPGFTAEASLDKTDDCYYSAIESDDLNGVIHPAQSLVDGIVNRPCVRYRCIPYIDLYGHATVKCRWIWVC